ncbi:MAG: glycerol-3-phosphate dehydrogenase/oxidase [Chloroflexi bacterium]|nr:glycerol-3-phosphate dehydrogenase/oxidase [Chloroflexota bacterium]
MPFDRPSMIEFIGAAEQPVDVLVIGGGATGLSVALESATRGYSTVLLERGDFAGGTSSLSTKLIHGGVRYLRQGRIRLVRESLRERRSFRRNAPHLVRPLPIVVPTYSRWESVKYGAGLFAYSAMSRGDGFGRARNLSSDAVLSVAPGIQSKGLRGGIVFPDGQTDDARLALAIAKTAASHGAAVLNYVAVRTLRTNHGRVTGVEAEDLRNGKSIEIDARVVINATGVHTDATLELDAGGSSGLIRWSRGTHITMDGSLLGEGHGLLIPETSDGRVVFALPWLRRTLIGTTDVNVDSPDPDPRAVLEDAEFLIDEVKRYLPEAGRSKVLSTFSGIRPLISNGSASPTSSISRSHRILVSRTGLLTIAGGKWTTARLMAEQVVSKAVEIARLRNSKSVTSGLKLEGHDETPDESIRSPSHIDEPDTLYGAEIAAIKDLEGRWPDLKTPLCAGVPYRLSHAVYGVLGEMAQTLEDVLSRRTRASLLDAGATSSAASRVVQAVRRYGGVEADWAANELADMQSSIAEFHGPPG